MNTLESYHRWCGWSYGGRVQRLRLSAESGAHQIIVARSGALFGVHALSANKAFLKIFFRDGRAIAQDKAHGEIELDADSTKRLVSRIAVLTNELATLPTSTYTGHQPSSSVKVLRVLPPHGYPIDAWFEQSSGLLQAAIIVAPTKADQLRPMSYQEVFNRKRYIDSWLIEKQPLRFKSLELNGKVYRGEVEQTDSD